MAKFTIPGRLPSLNTTFKVGKWRFWASKQRQEQKRWIASWIIAAKVPVFTRAVDVSVLWVEKDRRRDYDNISAGVKMILDALVVTGRIPNDNRKWVYPVIHSYDVDKKNPRIEVTVDEHKELARPELLRTA